MEEKLLEIVGLGKHYPSFDLKDVSFALKPGRIMGFIGRNGSGKTTTLKCIYNLVSPTSGTVCFEGRPLSENEALFKTQIGLLFGEVSYYPNKRLRVMTDVTRRFYPGWDEKLYEHYLNEFGLDDKKRIKELSGGMKVKYGLALALSHGAKMLLLDEPTSGLDPVSRDEVLDLFLSIVGDGQHGILFSTHVISDLEKCADDILYIQNGRIVANETVAAFKGSYDHYEGDSSALGEDAKAKFIYLKEHNGRFEAVAQAQEGVNLPFSKREASLEEIMIALERGSEDGRHPA
jgi:ABC-2 type transport system ATP-binding protein